MSGNAYSIRRTTLYYKVCSNPIVHRCLRACVNHRQVIDLTVTLWKQSPNVTRIVSQKEKLARAPHAAQWMNLATDTSWHHEPLTPLRISRGGSRRDLIPCCPKLKEHEVRHRWSWEGVLGALARSALCFANRCIESRTVERFPPSDTPCSWHSTSDALVANGLNCNVPAVHRVVPNAPPKSTIPKQNNDTDQPLQRRES